MTRLRLAVSLLVVAAAIVAEPAQAAPDYLTNEEPTSAPHLAGDQVVYLKLASTGNLVRLARTDQPKPRTLRTLPVAAASDEECCSSFIGAGLASSATRLATSTYRQDNAKGFVVGSETKLEAGPLTGDPVQVYQCSSGGPYDPGGYDLDGDRLAYVTGGCNTGNRSIVIRDLAAGADVVTITAPEGRTFWDVRLAGRYIAFQTSPSAAGISAPRETTVRDLQTGTDLYNVSAFNPFDLQDDGKLTINSDAGAGSGCASTVDWYSPAEPTRHATGICAASAPFIGGDRILVQRRAGGTTTQVVLSDLSGNARPLASAATPEGLGGIDFDGTRAAYVTNTCVPGTAGVYLDDLAPADPITVGADCPIKARGTRLRPDRAGRLEIKFSCENGCGGAVSINRGSTRLSTERDFGGFETTFAGVKLTRSARRLLARKRSLRVTIEGTHRVLSSANYEPFQRKVTLLAPRRAG